MQINDNDDNFVEIMRSKIRLFDDCEEEFHDPKESLKQSLKEVKLMREGKLPKKTWNEVKEGLEQDDELVQYFVVNSELNMSAGKVAAQVAHVATKITHEMCSKYPLTNNALISQEVRNEILNFYKWFEGDQAKIILRGKQKELEKLIENHMCPYIRDNGRTEISENSLTVVGFYPEYKSIMKPIVKRFQLL